MIFKKEFPTFALLKSMYKPTSNCIITQDHKYMYTDFPVGKRPSFHKKHVSMYSYNMYMYMGCDMKDSP